MSTLPTPLDYGNRPSVQVNRVDRPAGTSSEVAAAWGDAVASFNSVLEEQGEKQSKLDYALARNEILLADLEERNRLAEDQDWSTHDKRYGEAFKRRVEAIRAEYPGLRGYDSQLLDAEARMIGAKGRIDVGAGAKKVEISQGYAKLTKGIADATEEIINSKTGDRNTLMQGVLESINAAEEMGYFGVAGADAAEALRQGTTQQIAKAVLDTMPPAERKRVLTASQAYRRGYGINGDYLPLVLDAAKQTGLPPALIAAQLQKESSGDPNAKSGAFGDPTGLMQLGEAAAKDMGVTDRTNPAQSISGGSEYLVKMLDRFDGDKAKALAAYNMGPGALMEVMDEHGEEWFSALGPDYYAETKDYVEKLLPYWDGTAAPENYMTASNTGGGPLTPEDIAAGEGSGTIADFLHSDTVAKMLEQANREDKENIEREQSQALVSEAWDLYPEDHDARMKHIAQNSSGNVQKKAETDADLKNNRERQSKAQKAVETYDSYYKTMLDLADTDNPLTMDDISAEDRETMDGGQLKALEDAINREALDKQFADVTQFVDPGDGGMSLNKWNDLPNYGPNSKVSEDLDGPLWKAALNQDDWLKADAEQRALQAMEGQPIDPPNVGPLVKDVLVSKKYNGVTLKQDQDAIAARLELRLSAEVAQMQQQRNQKLSELEIRGILAGYMVETAYYDDPGFDNLRRDAMFTPEQLKTAYVPLADVMAARYAGPEPEMQGLTMYQFLKQKSKIIPGGPAKGASDGDIQRAYYAYTRGLGTEEVNARLRGE